MNHSVPGLPVHHQHPEFTQTHVHWVSDAIQPSRPLSSPSPPALNLSQNESFPMSQLFASGGQSIGVSTSTSVLPVNTQDWSLGWTLWISLLSKGLSRFFSNTTASKHQLKKKVCSVHLCLFFCFAYRVIGAGALGRPRGIGWEKEVGGEIGMGNTCKSMADSCQCMAKTTTIL